MCAVRFNKVHHWAFASMIGALCPAIKNKLPSRRQLSGKWLDKIEEQTREKTNDRLKRTKRKKTLIVDGFKDRRGRHCMNISCGVLGYIPYRWTEWFLRRRHTGTTYGINRGESGGTLGMRPRTAAAFNSIFKGSNCVHR